jgi:predicted transcriptional regulator
MKYSCFTCQLYTHYMAEEIGLTHSLIRRAENTELSLVSLEAIVEIRAHLDELESEAIKSARDKGATVEDIADAMGLTPQAIYHRLRNGGHPAKRGRPKSAAAQPTDG